MMRRPLAFLALMLLAAAAVAAQAPGQAEAPVDARTWIGRAAEIEEYMRSVRLLKLEDVPVGVTRPRKAQLPPGGPIAHVAWKVIPPGRSQGYWESYESEIAAYELDKLLGLNMVPPTVEKRHAGDLGAAVMWVTPAKSFKEMGATVKTGVPAPPPALANAWTRQLVRAKMFHNLTNNLDPNLGNWLVDPAWNLILIDCSRCFTPGRNMPHELTRVDPELWERMTALTEPQLMASLGKLMRRGAVRAILQRRDRMQEIVNAAIKTHGETHVFMRDVGR
ncbi:MAG TPA: hypothetical protein VFZ36_06030 [Vicinamibacterales bacterium]